MAGTDSPTLGGGVEATGRCANIFSHSKAQLEAAAQERKLWVPGTGMAGQPIKNDYIAALLMYDKGFTHELRSISRTFVTKLVGATLTECRDLATQYFCVSCEKLTKAEVCDAILTSITEHAAAAGDPDAARAAAVILSLIARFSLPCLGS